MVALCNTIFRALQFPKLQSNWLRNCQFAGFCTTKSFMCKLWQMQGVHESFIPNSIPWKERKFQQFLHIHWFILTLKFTSGKISLKNQFFVCCAILPKNCLNWQNCAFSQTLYPESANFLHCDILQLWISSVCFSFVGLSYLSVTSCTLVSVRRATLQ